MRHVLYCWMVMLNFNKRWKLMTECPCNSLFFLYKRKNWEKGINSDTADQKYSRMTTCALQTTVYHLMMRTFVQHCVCRLASVSFIVEGPGLAPLEIVSFQSKVSRGGCSGPFLVGMWISPGMEAKQPLCILSFRWVFLIFQFVTTASCPVTGWGISVDKCAENLCQDKILKPVFCFMLFKYWAVTEQFKMHQEIWAV